MSLCPSVIGTPRRGSTLSVVDETLESVPGRSGAVKVTSAQGTPDSCKKLLPRMVVLAADKDEAAQLVVHRRLGRLITRPSVLHRLHI
jgi:hypothetical protein